MTQIVNYFTNVYPTGAEFALMLADLEGYYGAGMEWFDNVMGIDMTADIMWAWFASKFSGRTLRYDVDTFKHYFQTIMATHLPELYTQLTAFTKRELNLLSDYKSRGASLDTLITSTSDTIGNYGTSTTPSDTAGDNLDMTAADYLSAKTKSQQNTTGNADNTVTSYNLRRNLMELIKTKFRYPMGRFLSHFSCLFRQVYPVYPVRSRQW